MKRFFLLSTILIALSICLHSGYAQDVDVDPPTVTITVPEGTQGTAVASLTDLTPLTGLTDLTSLTVQHTQANNLIPLAELVGLTSLTLTGNSITDIT